MADSKRSKKIRAAQSRRKVAEPSEASECQPKTSSPIETKESNTLGSGSEEGIKGPCEVCDRITQQICICQQVFYCCKKHEDQDYCFHKSNCLPFTVPLKTKSNRSYSSGANASTKGTIPLEDRYIVARKLIEPVTVLFKETPILIAPNYVQSSGGIQDPKKMKSQSFCLGCLEDFDGVLDSGGTSLVFSMCPSCKLPLCKRCYTEKENGKHSQYECLAIKNARKNIGDVMNLKNKRPYQNEELIKDLTVLRAIILQKTNLSHWTAFINLKFNVRFTNSLRTTPEVVKSWVKTKTPIAENYMNTVGENFVRLEDVKRIIGLFSTASVKNPRMRILYDFISWMPQSCHPNAEIYTTDGQNHEITVKTVDKIESNTEISLNYISENEGGLPTAALKLYSEKAIICRCGRCKHDVFDTSVAVMCIAEKCKGFLRPKAPTIEPGTSFPNVYSSNYIWQCNVCKKPRRFTSIQKHVEDIVKEVRKDVDDYSQKKCVKSDSVLSENVEKKLHKNHWLTMKFEKFLLQSLNSQIGFGIEMLQNAVSKVRPQTFLYSVEKKKIIYFATIGRNGLLQNMSETRGSCSEITGIYKFDAFYVLLIDFLENFKADCIKDWKVKGETNAQNSVDYVSELRRIMNILKSTHESLSSSADPKHRGYGRIAQKSYEAYLSVYEKILSKPSSANNIYLQDLLLSYTVCDPTFPRSVFFNKTDKQPTKRLIFGQSHEMAMKFEDLPIDGCEEKEQDSQTASSSDSGATREYDSDGSSSSGGSRYSHFRRYASHYGFPPGFPSVYGFPPGNPPGYPGNDCHII